MVEPSPDPIPKDLREAFHDAVALFSDWNRGGPEPDVSLQQRPWPISAVCSLVMKFNDPMPENVLHRLCSQIDPTDLRDTSYGSGARCLYSAINARKAEYQQRRQL
jgi:hypothetical protein